MGANNCDMLIKMFLDEETIYQTPEQFYLLKIKLLSYLIKLTSNIFSSLTKAQTILEGIVYTETLHHGNCLGLILLHVNFFNVNLVLV